MNIMELRLILSEALIGSEFENCAYFVGGCVRDHCLKRQSDDFDVCVDILKGGTRCAEFLHSLGLVSKPVLYKQFGTALVEYCGVNLEFVETRSDSRRSDNGWRHNQDSSLSTDVMRRDFSINTLMMRIKDGEILDQTGIGIDDLNSGLIRSIGKPSQNFAADPLRLLRAIRFACDLDFSIEEETWRELCACVGMVCRSSKERISSEMFKIMTSSDPVVGIRLLQESGMLRFIIPELLALVGFEQNKYHNQDVFNHTLSVLENSPAELYTRWAALLHDIAKPTTLSVDLYGIRHFYRHEITGGDISEIVLKRFNVPQKKRIIIARIIKNHMIFKQSGKNGELCSDSTLLRLMDDFGEDINMLLDLIHADNLSHHQDHCLREQIPTLRLRIEKLRSEKGITGFLLSGRDLINEFNLNSGPLIGELLYYTRAKWYEFPDMTKADLLDHARIILSMKRQP